MEKRVFGIVLTLLGIAGLILAAYSFVKGKAPAGEHAKAVLVYVVLGLIFFFAGVGLLRSTKDVTPRS